MAITLAHLVLSWASIAWRGPSPSALSARRAVHPRATAVEPAAADGAASVALAFGQALAAAWRGDRAALEQLLSVDVKVDTPVWQHEDRTDYLESLAGAAAFFSNEDSPPPTLLVLSQRRLGPGEARV